MLTVAKGTQGRVGKQLQEAKGPNQKQALWQPSKRSTYYFLGIMKKRYEVAGDHMMQ
jgi:hypothetical protein